MSDRLQALSEEELTYVRSYCAAMLRGELMLALRRRIDGKSKTFHSQSILNGWMGADYDEWLSSIRLAQDLGWVESVGESHIDKHSLFIEHEWRFTAEGQEAVMASLPIYESLKIPPLEQEM